MRRLQPFRQLPREVSPDDGRGEVRLASRIVIERPAPLAVAPDRCVPLADGDDLGLGVDDAARVLESGDVPVDARLVAGERRGVAVAEHGRLAGLEDLGMFALKPRVQVPAVRCVHLDAAAVGVAGLGDARPRGASAEHALREDGTVGVVDGTDHDLVPLFDAPSFLAVVAQAQFPFAPVEDGEVRPAQEPHASVLRDDAKGVGGRLGLLRLAPGFAHEHRLFHGAPLSLFDAHHVRTFPAHLLDDVGEEHGGPAASGRGFGDDGEDGVAADDDDGLAVQLGPRRRRGQVRPHRRASGQPQSQQQVENPFHRFRIIPNQNNFSRSA